MSVPNEQTKLTATYLNGMAIAIFAGGCLVPLVTAFSADNLTTEHFTKVLFLALVSFLLSFYIHTWARSYLWILRDDNDD